jgi:hypothetical protein
MYEQLRSAMKFAVVERYGMIHAAMHHVPGKAIAMVCVGSCRSVKKLFFGCVDRRAPKVSHEDMRASGRHPAAWL